MPPCTRREDRLDVPLPKSSFSTSATRNPRSAASRATPHPVTPPPTTSRSNAVADSASRGAAGASVGMSGPPARPAVGGGVSTADAVARVLRRDRDEVIDLLDDMLIHDDEHPEGVVHEAGSLDVADDRGATRHLWLYRFDAALDWLTLAHHGLRAEDDRRAAARALAQA